MKRRTVYLGIVALGLFALLTVKKSPTGFGAGDALGRRAVSSCPAFRAHSSVPLASPGRRGRGVYRRRHGRPVSRPGAHEISGTGQRVPPSFRSSAPTRAACRLSNCVRSAARSQDGALAGRHVLPPLSPRIIETRSLGYTHCFWPPCPEERLSYLAAGRVRFRRKRPWHGQREILLEPASRSSLPPSGCIS